MEKYTEVKTYSVVYICDTCSEGEMVFDGLTLTSYPPLYPHTCDKCGDKKNLRTRYPLTKSASV